MTRPTPVAIRDLARKLSRIRYAAEPNPMNTDTIRELIEQGLDANGNPTEHLLKPDANLRLILADAVDEQGDSELASRIRTGTYAKEWGLDSDGLPTKNHYGTLAEWVRHQSHPVLTRIAGSDRHRDILDPEYWNSSADFSDHLELRGTTQDDGSWDWDREPTRDHMGYRRTPESWYQHIIARNDPQSYQTLAEEFETDFN